MLGKTSDSDIGAELGSGFELLLGPFCEVVSNNASGDHIPAQVRNRRSQLKKIRQVWLTTCATEMQDAARLTPCDKDQLGWFARVLNQAILQANLTISEVAARVNTPAVMKWAEGKSQPSRQKLPTLRRIEEILGLRSGTLTA